MNDEVYLRPLSLGKPNCTSASTWRLLHKSFYNVLHLNRIISFSHLLICRWNCYSSFWHYIFFFAWVYLPMPSKLICPDCGANSFLNRQMHLNFPKCFFCLYFFHVQKNMCSKQQFYMAKVISYLSWKATKKKKEQSFSLSGNFSGYFILYFFKIVDCNHWRSEAAIHIISCPCWELGDGINCWEKSQADNWDGDYFSHPSFSQSNQ